MAQTFDYREILKTLNSIGYSNISAAELKAFKKDLNTLIKYESGNSSKLNTNVRVHSARQHQENDGLGRTETLVNPNLPKGSSSKKQEAHRFRSAQLDERKDKDTQTNMERPRSTAKKPKITNQQQAKYKIPTRQVLVKNTPVDLYQKYRSDWEKFKKYIPGDNSREEVRKVVRRRVQKPPPPKPTVYIRYANGHKYTQDMCM